MKPGVLTDALTLRREWELLQEWSRNPTLDWKVALAARDARTRTPRVRRAAFTAVIGSAIVGPLTSPLLPLVVVPIATAFAVAASRKERFLRPAGQIVEAMDTLAFLTRRGSQESVSPALVDRLNNAQLLQEKRLAAACKSYKEPVGARPLLNHQAVTLPPIPRSPGSAAGRERGQIIPFPKRKGLTPERP